MPRILRLYDEPSCSASRPWQSRCYSEEKYEPQTHLALEFSSQLQETICHLE